MGKFSLALSEVSHELIETWEVKPGEHNYPDQNSEAQGKQILKPTKKKKIDRIKGSV